MALPELLEAARTEKHRAELPYQIAHIYDLKQKPTEARRWYTQALYIDPFSEAAHNGLAKLAMRLGRTKAARSTIDWSISWCN